MTFNHSQVKVALTEARVLFFNVRPCGFGCTQITKNKVFEFWIKMVWLKMVAYNYLELKMVGLKRKTPEKTPEQCHSYDFLTKHRMQATCKLRLLSVKQTRLVRWICESERVHHQREGHVFWGALVLFFCVTLPRKVKTPWKHPRAHHSCSVGTLRKMCSIDWTVDFVFLMFYSTLILGIIRWYISHRFKVASEGLNSLSYTWSVSFNKWFSDCVCVVMLAFWCLNMISLLFLLWCFTNAYERKTIWIPDKTLDPFETFSVPSLDSVGLFEVRLKHKAFPGASQGIAWLNALCLLVSGPFGMSPTSWDSTARPAYKIMAFCSWRRVVQTHKEVKVLWLELQQIRIDKVYQT